jgi:hypothetical protein
VCVCVCVTKWGGVHQHTYLGLNCSYLIPAARNSSPTHTKTQHLHTYLRRTTSPASMSRAATRACPRPAIHMSLLLTCSLVLHSFSLHMNCGNCEQLSISKLLLPSFQSRTSWRPSVQRNFTPTGCAFVDLFVDTTHTQTHAHYGETHDLQYVRESTDNSPRSAAALCRSSWSEKKLKVILFFSPSRFLVN